MVTRKEFGLTLIFWFFLGGIGAHRIYITERTSIVLWYWLANICTLGILCIVDLFLLKSMIDKKFEEDTLKNKIINL